MLDFGGGEEIRFERNGKAGVITLTRPAALNALTHNMVLAISNALDDWERDNRVELVFIRGEGRAFCAGGDIQAIYHAGISGSPLYDFFADEYRLTARIKAYTKPYIALIDGIVMGGGVGVSIHGSHRIFTENAKFAMPEVTIGFFPDVGGSYFLPRLPGNAGLWLGLTGTRIGWGDALSVGLASHCISADRLDDLVSRLAESGDPQTTLSGFSEKPDQMPDDETFSKINRLFGGSDVAALIAGLKTEAANGSEFAAETLAKLAKASPTSLHVAFRQIRAGAMLTMRECMAMEYRIVSRMLQGDDFYEGIRSAVIEKDGAPVWKPADIGDVDEIDIDRYFAPLGEAELTLPDETNGASSQ